MFTSTRYSSRRSPEANRVRACGASPDAKSDDERIVRQETEKWKLIGNFYCRFPWGSAWERWGNNCRKSLINQGLANEIGGPASTEFWSLRLM